MKIWKVCKNIKKQQICLHSFSLEFPFLGTFQYSYLSYTLSKIEVKPWTKAFSSLLRLSERVDLFLNWKEAKTCLRLFIDRLYWIQLDFAVNKLLKVIHGNQVGGNMVKRNTHQNSWEKYTLRYGDWLDNNARASDSNWQLSLASSALALKPLRNVYHPSVISQVTHVDIFCHILHT